MFDNNINNDVDEIVTILPHIGRSAAVRAIEMYGNAQLAIDALLTSDIFPDIPKDEDEKRLPFTAPMDSDEKVNYKNTDGEVPESYRVFSCKYIVNMFPKIEISYLIEKMKEFKFHLFPSFRYFFLRYQLCSLTLHPSDEDDVYGINNDIKAHLVGLESDERKISDEEYAQAFQDYPNLSGEIQHLEMKKERYSKKFTETLELYLERYKLLDIYEEDKKVVEATKLSELQKDSDFHPSQDLLNSVEVNIPHPLYECNICSFKYLFEELVQCRNTDANHFICKSFECFF
jgi:hypothetical protein